MKKAFTLAEIMIVLMVIGLLTAILLPAARNAMPNEDLMKFKKAHLTLINAIQELVNSDRYYLNGDLGIKPDKTLIDGTHEGDTKYFCQTLADVLNTESVDCKETDTAAQGYRSVLLTSFLNLSSEIDGRGYEAFDKACMRQAPQIKGEITTSNDIVFYQSAPGLTFGMSHTQAANPACAHESEEVCARRFFLNQDTYGLPRTYKIFCIDIDGIPENVDKYNCVNECPFGYGIRYDGKILNGIRANEWFLKSIQEK